MDELKRQKRDDDMKKVGYQVSDSGWEYVLSDIGWKNYMGMLNTNCQATDNYFMNGSMTYEEYKIAFEKEKGGNER